jgi:BirA family biotin operon repressor/biotin-[acetyl-CoA-carboxylase] ligase
LRVVPSTGSTNTDLLALARDAAVPSFTTVATFDQTSGRGRLDRSWVAPAGVALAVSVLVRDALRSPVASWVPLLAGVAMTETLDELRPGAVGLKWPNDVLLEERKVCGILVELTPAGDAVVGAGVNLRQTEAQLPVPTATSLELAGIAVDDAVIDGMLAGYLGRLRAALESPAPADEVRERVTRRCSTIGRRVRIETPDGGLLTGTASGLDRAGRLEVRDDDGATRAVAVGDVIHARAD